MRGQFIGLTIEEATDLAEGNSVIWHVAEIDGEPSVATPPVERHVAFDLEDDVVIAAVSS